MLERRYSGLEFRAAGRRLVGPAMVYNTVSPSHKERFEPGAFDLSSTIWLDLRHNTEMVVAHSDGGGLVLVNSPGSLDVTATLPKIPLADRALVEVANGKLQGFSVEFRATQESMDGAIRVVEKAELAGIGLVENPSYSQSTVEVRRLRRGFRGTVPTSRKLSCGCHRGSCSEITIDPGAFDESLASGREILAIHGDYSRAVASLKRGSLRLKKTEKGLTAEIDLPDSTAGRDLLAQAETVPIIFRPIFDQDASEFTETGNVAEYSQMHLKAVLIGATDADGGWPEAEITGERSRRARRWL